MRYYLHYQDYIIKVIDGDTWEYHPLRFGTGVRWEQATRDTGGYRVNPTISRPISPLEIKLLYPKVPNV